MGEPANSLEQWQNRVGRHFESLARSRTDSGLHLFALEHGLNDEEIDEVSSLLRFRLNAGLPASPRWLRWVVCAAEEGDGCKGGE